MTGKVCLPTAPGPAMYPFGQGVTNYKATLAEWRLMTRVYERCHQAIAHACEGWAVPTEFLGALTATESGGNARAQRFEPAVYRHLAEVAAGKQAAYGSVTSEALRAKLGRAQRKSGDFHAQFLAPDFTEQNRAALTALPDKALRSLATSWGYTQIMGYHTVGRPESVRDLLDPAIHFRLALELVEEFCQRFALDPSLQFAELFFCWNTGKPFGPPRGPATYDPNYVFNGLTRMAVYRAVVEEASNPEAASNL